MTSMSSILQLLSFASFFISSASAIPAPSKRNTNSTIQWTDCSPSPSISLKCTNFSVPLDWNHPSNAHINLIIAMIPAANTTHRIGYLFTNPGGPGVPDISAGGQGDLGDTITGAYWRSTELHQYFDIVGPDPRGVALSSPLECDPELWNTASHTSLFPQDEDSYHELVNIWKRAGESCAKMSGEKLKFVDTASVARDFEALRIALGDEPFNYLGFSYGTQIGSQYAELFPKNIRAMVLDAVLDHSQSSPTHFLETESSGFEMTLDQFFTWCALNETCAYYNTTNFPAVFDQNIDAANESPIPAPQCLNTSSTLYPCKPTVSGYDILTFLRTLLISPSPENGLGLPGLVITSYLLELAFEERDASYFSLPNITSSTDTSFPETAVSCLDQYHENLSWEEFQNKMFMVNTLFPHTRGQGQFWGDQIRCANWPVPTINPPHSIAHTFRNLTLERPVLLVNALYDPETNYPYAVNMQRKFGGERNAVLVSRNGTGHTSWYTKGETHFVINDYLVDLKVHEGGTVLQS